ncbi:MAG: nicotinamide-nucleotide amidase [Oceanotoga sp.]|jgi:PncC family amidohydrolase|nr:nicotinamide-nucleotide amidase [Oceanotoga sp.]
MVKLNNRGDILKIINIVNKKQIDNIKFNQNQILYIDSIEILKEFFLHISSNYNEKMIPINKIYDKIDIENIMIPDKCKILDNFGYLNFKLDNFLIIYDKINCKQYKEYTIFGYCEDNILIEDFILKNEIVELIDLKFKNNQLNIKLKTNLNIQFIFDLYYKYHNIIFYENTMTQILINKLKQVNYTISTAESCTGGMISSQLVDYPGVSDIFLGSIISYSNKIKKQVLGVKKITLEKYGAVSSECVKEMVDGLYKIMHTDVCISVSGIAGPGGGTFLKPVGTVYFAFKIKKQIIVKNKLFSGNREEIREKSKNYAIYFLTQHLMSIEEG